jgi:ubiquinone/menaquinone biosynthesis C-methylase UbiE
MAECDTRAYYDHFSTSYDKTRNSAYHRMLDDQVAEVALPYARNARVLDLGCGTGRILEPLSRVAKEAVGVDFSERMVERARAKHLDARLADLRSLPLDSGAFDLTYSFKVLPHVREIERAMSEAVRVTKSGGHLLLEVYNPHSIRYLAKQIAVATGQVGSRAEVFTRWDCLSAARALIPPEATLIDYYGIRVLTPAAAVHRLPVLGANLRRAEGLAMRSPLRRYGGFLILLLRRS